MGVCMLPVLHVCEGTWISVEPGTASKPRGSLRKERELAAVSRESSTAAPGCPSEASVWVTLGTCELPVYPGSPLYKFRGLNSGSLGMLSAGVSCCMDGFAIQKGSVDTNLSSAM